MTLRVSLLLFLIGGLKAVLPAQSPTDELWRKTVKQVQSTKPLVASMILTKVEVYDGEGAYLGTLERSDRLEAWNGKDKPKRRQTASTTKGSPGFTMEISLGIENKPADALEGLDYFNSLGNAQLNGATVAVFEASGHSGKDLIQAKVFVDPASQRPVKIDYRIPIRSSMGNRTVQASVWYRPDRDGNWLPHRLLIDQTGRYLFWKRRIIVEKSFEDWSPATT